jgi:hypothetical protein
VKKIIILLLFLSVQLNVKAQKHSIGIGCTAFNHFNDGYGYKFNQFSNVFRLTNKSAHLYKLMNFHLFYAYNLDSLYSIRFSNDLFTREYRNPKGFINADEVGLEARVFSVSVLSLNKQMLSKLNNRLKVNSSLGLAFRDGDEFFHAGVFPPEVFTHTIRLKDLGIMLGGEARYNFHKNVFMNAHISFIQYVIGVKPKYRSYVFIKNWTASQISFSVGANF